MVTGCSDEQFAQQFGEVIRTFTRCVAVGGLTTKEAYFVCVRRFPDAMYPGYVSDLIIPESYSFITHCVLH